jgi:hypothetical protein
MFQGEKYYIVFIGAKGDGEWHSSTAGLNRSYQNSGTVNQCEICHLDLAGAENFPYEQVGFLA